MYVKKTAYIELVILRGLDWAVLRKGLYDFDSFLEFPFGHCGAEVIVALSDMDNQSMVGRARARVFESEELTGAGNAGPKLDRSGKPTSRTNAHGPSIV